MVRDYGFAPNPFHGYCTLATCKPQIRRTAQLGDYVVGIGSVAQGRGGHLVYCMQVEETLTFEDYWADNRFEEIYIGGVKESIGFKRTHTTVCPTARQIQKTFAQTRA